MEKLLGKLNVSKGTFNTDERLIVSENLGVICRLNVNDFESDEQCEKIAEFLIKNVK